MNSFGKGNRTARAAPIERMQERIPDCDYQRLHHRTSGWYAFDVIGFDEPAETIQPTGWVLAFHSDLIRGTSLGRQISEYGFLGTM